MGYNFWPRVKRKLLIEWKPVPHISIWNLISSCFRFPYNENSKPQKAAAFLTGDPGRCEGDAFCLLPSPSTQLLARINLVLSLVFRIMVPCSLECGYQRFGGTLCFHLQVHWNPKDRGDTLLLNVGNQL
jgi:hypothetical protein